jgi:quinol monooxygenase YgiN
MNKIVFLFSFLLLLTAIAMAQSSAPATKASTVFVVVHIDVMPPYTKEAVSLLQALMHDSRKDPGSVSFKVLQEPVYKNHFTLVEEWAGQDAYDKYVSSAHTRQFREKIQPMLGSPFDERIHAEVELK